MKTKVFMMMAAVCFTLTAAAKNIKTVVFKTQPEMHCSNCESKIKNNIRFEKGVKDITTNLNTKTVTVKYDADKTTVNDLVKGFSKINYTATVYTDGVTGSTPQNVAKKADKATKNAEKKVKNGKKKVEQKAGECCKDAEKKVKDGKQKAEEKAGECCKKAEQKVNDAKKHAEQKAKDVKKKAENYNRE